MTATGSGVPFRTGLPKPDPTAPVDPATPLPTPRSPSIGTQIGGGAIGATGGFLGGAIGGALLGTMIDVMNGAHAPSSLGAVVLGGIGFCTVVGAGIGVGVARDNALKRETERIRSEYGEPISQVAADEFRQIESRDPNANGLIDLRPYDSEMPMHRLWRAVDADESNSISQEEFVRYATTFDSDRSGTLTPAEARRWEGHFQPPQRWVEDPTAYSYEEIRDRLLQQPER